MKRVSVKSSLTGPLKNGFLNNVLKKSQKKRLNKLLTFRPFGVTIRSENKKRLTLYMKMNMREQFWIMDSELKKYLCENKMKERNRKRKRRERK